MPTLSDRCNSERFRTVREIIECIYGELYLTVCCLCIRVIQYLDCPPLRNEQVRPTAKDDPPRFFVIPECRDGICRYVVIIVTAATVNSGTLPSWGYL